MGHRVCVKRAIHANEYGGAERTTARTTADPSAALRDDNAWGDHNASGGRGAPIHANECGGGRENNGKNNCRSLRDDNAWGDHNASGGRGAPIHANECGGAERTTARTTADPCGMTMHGGITMHGAGGAVQWLRARLRACAVTRVMLALFAHTFVPVPALCRECVS